MMGQVSVGAGSLSTGKRWPDVNAQEKRANRSPPASGHCTVWRKARYEARFQSSMFHISEFQSLTHTPSSRLETPETPPL